MTACSGPNYILQSIEGLVLQKWAKIKFSQSLNVWNLAWSYMWHKGFSVGNGGIIVVLLFLGLKRFDGIILEVE